MEYGHEQVVVGGINVNYDVYRIYTPGSEATVGPRHEFDFERLAYGT